MGRWLPVLVALLLDVTVPAVVRANIVAVDIDGVIHPITVEIIASAVEQARRDNAPLLLLRLDTPGGLMEAMRQSVEKIVGSPVPVVAYVTPSGGRAASAGFFILEAADVAAMAPGTNTGAAHPVMLTGTQLDPVVQQKLENDAAAFLRSLTAKRGRNPELAEKAVLESRSFTDQEALKQGLIDIVATDERELLARLDGRDVVRFDGSKQRLQVRDAKVVTYQKSLRQRVFAALADPNLALAMLILGALGIYIEFSAPGLILPGVAGAILAILGLSAISLLPINWTGAALLLLALALFALEVKVASHGILGAGGAVAMILGAVLLVDSPLPELRVRLSTAIALALPFALITTFLVALAVRARGNRIVTGTEGMIGQVGLALTDITPSGRIFVHGEYWNAQSATPIKAGDKARVTAIRGLDLTVEPVDHRQGEEDANPV